MTRRRRLRRPLAESVPAGPARRGRSRRGGPRCRRLRSAARGKAGAAGRGGGRADTLARPAGGLTPARAGPAARRPRRLARAVAGGASAGGPVAASRGGAGATAAAAWCAPGEAALVAAYLTVTGPASAAVRLLALDPIEVSAAIARLSGSIEAAAARGRRPRRTQQPRTTWQPRTNCLFPRHQRSTCTPRPTPERRCVSLHPDHGHSHAHPHGHARGADVPARPGAGTTRALRIGIGGPVGSGKAALVAALCRALGDRVRLAVVTNDIYTTEDADFLCHAAVLDPSRIQAVHTRIGLIRTGLIRTGLNRIGLNLVGPNRIEPNLMEPNLMGPGQIGWRGRPGRFRPATARASRSCR